MQNPLLSPFTPPAPFSSFRQPRISLYSHDTCGLGHMRRNLLIARTLMNTYPDANILLITGERDANAFPLPSANLVEVQQ